MARRPPFIQRQPLLMVESTCPMRIAHYIDLSEIGGIQTSFVNLLENSTFANAFSHSVIHRTNGHPMPDLVARLRSADITVNWDRTRLKTPQALLRLRRASLDRAMFEMADARLCLYWSALPAPSVVSALMGRGTRSLFYDRGFSTRKSPTTEKVALFQKFDAIICNSRASAAMWKLKWHCTGPVHVNLNAIRSDVLRVTDSIVPKPAPDLNKELNLGFAGRLIATKGAAMAVLTAEAIRQHGIPVVLHLAGQGPEQDRLRQLAREHNMESSVRFWGLCHDMSVFYRTIDVLLCPSLREPFGLVSVEAQAWGCPVVVSSVDGLPETIEDGRTGRSVRPTMSLEAYSRFCVDTTAIPVSVYDPVSARLRPPAAPMSDALAEAVLSIVSRPEDYKQMSKAAIERAQTVFAFDTHVERLLQILRHYA